MASEAAAAQSNPVKRPPPKKKKERVLGLPPDRLSDEHIWSRRDFFSLTGWAMVFGSLSVAGVKSGSGPSPRSFKTNRLV